MIKPCILQHQIWETLEKDPLFAKPATKPTLKEFRLLTLKRVKKLIKIQFDTSRNVDGKALPGICC